MATVQARQAWQREPQTSRTALATRNKTFKAKARRGVACVWSTICSSFDGMSAVMCGYLRLLANVRRLHHLLCKLVCLQSSPPNAREGGGGGGGSSKRRISKRRGRGPGGRARSGQTRRTRRRRRRRRRRRESREQQIEDEDEDEEAEAEGGKGARGAI